MKEKSSLNFERLDWYSYIIRRAIANKEPKTAWDACVSMISHFEQVYGETSQELKDERFVHGQGHYDQD